MGSAALEYSEFDDFPLEPEVIRIDDVDHLSKVFTKENILNRLRRIPIIDKESVQLKELLGEELDNDSLEEIFSVMSGFLEQKEEFSVEYLSAVFKKACGNTAVYEKFKTRILIDSLLNVFFKKNIDPLVADNNCQLRAISFF